MVWCNHAILLCPLQGHAVSGALFGGHGGGSEQTAYQQDAAPAPYQGYDQPTSGQQMQGPCQFEMQQFIECAQNQRDITLCQGFNEALRQCKLANGKKHFIWDKTNKQFKFIYNMVSLCRRQHDMLAVAVTVAGFQFFFITVYCFVGLS